MVSIDFNSSYKTDRAFMLEAISLASSANSDVYPNPKVGCVIVEGNKIISKGYHQKYGSNHAERNAIECLEKNKSNLTMYVTLEPCHHHGKTLPCTGLIKPNQFNRVVIAEEDPSKLAGGGAIYLKKNNINVDIGICKEEAREINKYFYTFHEKKRPYIILKYASSLDGYIALENGESKWITSSKSRSINHRQRSECDAILVGRKTIELDNPILDSHGKGKNPQIIVIDSDDKINKNSKIFRSDKPPFIFRKKDFANSKGENIKIILKKLFKMNIQSVLVEGGGSTITYFLKSGLFDEIHAYIAPKFFGKGIPLYKGKGSIENIYNLKISHVDSLGDDVRIVYKKDR